MIRADTVNVSADRSVTHRSLGLLVTSVAREFTARTATVLHRHGLTDAGWWLLSELATAPVGGLPLGEAARRAGVGASTATSLSDQFADRGLLIRQRCPANRRLVLAELTGTGHHCVAAVRADISDLFAAVYQRLSCSERDTLTDLLSRLLETGTSNEPT